MFLRSIDKVQVVEARSVGSCSLFHLLLLQRSNYCVCAGMQRLGSSSIATRLFAALWLSNRSEELIIALKVLKTGNMMVNNLNSTPYADRPPLWSNGQNSWLQIRRPGFDSRHYQKKRYWVWNGVRSAS
jgi:hypothetical protein